MEAPLPLMPVNSQTLGMPLGNLSKLANQSGQEMLYTELSGLHSIRKEGAKDPKAGLYKVAKQFESMLLKMMLSSMRDVNDSFNAGGMFDSHESKMFRQLYDDQLALDLSKRGVGLADTFYRQMVREYLPSSQEGAVDTRLPEGRVPLSMQYAISPQISSKPADTAEQPTQKALAEPNEAVKAMADDTFSPKGATPKAEASTTDEAELDTSSPQRFIESLRPYAQKAANALGVNVKAILAQAALETGWGQHIMKTPKGENSFNLFGIKADTRWQGGKVSANTLEFEKGIAQKVTAAFRQYDSLESTFKDYVRFLKGSPRYEQALGTNSVEQFAEALQSGGYATDPMYAKKIASIANREGFQDWANRGSEESRL